MAKGFIDTPQEGDCVQWSESLGPNRQNTQVAQTGQGDIANHTPVTPDEEHTDDRTISSASSQENLPPLSASLQSSPQQSSTSPSPFSPMPSHPPPSPSFSSAPSPTLPTQLDPSSPSLPSSSHLPPLPNQLTEPSSPPFHTACTPVLSSPYSPAQSGPYEQASSISVEELQELAIQDSANNNVDENSNDQQYDRYANYHQEYSQMQFVPDQSVRPRVRRGAGVARGEEEPDSVPATRPDIGQRGNSEGEGPRYSHRRNLSEGPPSTSLGYWHDSTHEHPPLPNFNASSGCACPLPRVPNLHPSSSGEEHHGRENWIEERGRWTSSPGRWLPLSLRGGGYGPPPPPEDTTRGAQELLVNFTTDVLHSHSLQVPQDVRAQGGFSNLTMSRAGRELRMLADTFAETEERRRVRCMAETVDMHSMNMENFFQLCAELFSDGITRERIVALFTFIGDVAVHQVRLRGEQFLQILLNWSLKYLVDHVCCWVQDAGGWAVVLCQGANILYRTAVFVFCVCGSLAAGLFIYKTLKDW